MSINGKDFKFSNLSPAKTFYAAQVYSLLETMESNKVPINAACRGGVCGCRKTQILEGEYSVNSNMPLTSEEISQGYVLTCSCHLQGDLVLYIAPVSWARPFIYSHPLSRRSGATAVL